MDCRVASLLAMTAKQLPDPNPLLWRQIHLVARLHVKGLVPFVHVADDAVNPIFGGRMFIAQKLGAKRSFAVFALPAVAIGDEEALIAGHSIDHRRFAMRRDIAAIG